MSRRAGLSESGLRAKSALAGGLLPADPDRLAPARSMTVPRPRAPTYLLVSAPLSSSGGARTTRLLESAQLVKIAPEVPWDPACASSDP